MKEINIATIVSKKRREKGLTQDDLASFMGVSKASVSKWETGQSYPDIVLLPLLASFFDISIDELLGYSPQMTKEDIRNLYKRLSYDFTQKPIEEVYEECQDLIKKYSSCYELIYSIISLLINHCSLLTEPAAQNEVLETILVLSKKIQENSDNPSLVKDAWLLEVIVSIQMQKFSEALNLLGENIRPLTQETELLAQVYHALGNIKAADGVIQVSIFQHLLYFVQDSILLMMLHLDNKDKALEIYSRTLETTQIFHMENFHPNTMCMLYFNGAQMYMTYGDKEKTYECLNRFTEIVTEYFFPCTLHGDDYFDNIDSWFNDLELGTLAPRNDIYILDSLLQALIHVPTFSSLAGEKEFQQIIKKIEKVGKKL